MKETGEVKGEEGRGWIVRVGANESQTDSQIQWSLGRALCRGSLHTAALQRFCYSFTSAKTSKTCVASNPC